MVVEDISGDYDNFRIPASQISTELLYELAGEYGLNPETLPEGTTVDYGEELEETLEEVDGRRDHDRALDAAIGKAVELKENRAYDLILTEVEYDIMEYRNQGSDDIFTRKQNWYQGEIDLMLVDVDNQVVRAVEVKPHKGYKLDKEGNKLYDLMTHRQKAEEQMERQSFAFDLLNEELEGFEMHFIPEKPLFESELLPEEEIPDVWNGQYRGRDAALRGMENNPEFRTFMEDFVIGNNPGIMAPENELSREENNLGDFIGDYLEE